MYKALKRFTTILLSSFFLIVSVNFAVTAQNTQNKTSTNNCNLLSFSPELVKSPRFWICGFIFLICLIVVFGYREALRSPGIKGKCKEGDKIVEAQGKPNPYSLSLSQLAFWTVVILGSYLLIYAATGAYENTFSGSASILLGINGGTAVVNALIDGDKKEFEQKGSARTSEWFLPDILSDGNGYNLHRIQTFIWTIALVFVFIHEVIKCGKMPDFDSSLLTLQGISSATFIGLRPTEKQENKEKPSENKTKLTFSMDEKDNTLKLDKVEIHGTTLDKNNSFTDKSDLKITEKPVINTVEIEVKKSP